MNWTVEFKNSSNRINGVEIITIFIKKYAFLNFEKIKKFEIAPAGFPEIFSESKYWKKCSPKGVGSFSLKIVQI